MSVTARLFIARVLHALVGRHSLYESRIGHLPVVACRFCDLDRYRRTAA